jgi:hypothetical protein
MDTAEDWSKMTKRQRFGYLLVRLLGKMQQWIYHYVIKDQVWRSADGVCTPIREMDDRHLINSYNMCMRNGRSGVVKTLKAEMFMRGLLPIPEVRRVGGRSWR